MPSFAGRLSNVQIPAVAKYVSQNAGKVASTGGWAGALVARSFDGRSSEVRFEPPEVVEMLARPQ